MDVNISWMGGMSFEGSADSGFIQKMDADLSVGGSNSAVRPMELIAFGLAGCTGMDVISILQKKRQPIVDFQVNAHLEKAQEHPKVFSKAIIEYIVFGRNVEAVAVLRAIELSAEKYCPAQAMLSKVFPIQMKYKILDEESRLVVSEGEYRLKSVG